MTCFIPPRDQSWQAGAEGKGTGGPSSCAPEADLLPHVSLRRAHAPRGVGLRGQPAGLRRRHDLVLRKGHARPAGFPAGQPRRRRALHARRAGAGRRVFRPRMSPRTRTVGTSRRCGNVWPIRFTPPAPATRPWRRGPGGRAVWARTACGSRPATPRRRCLNCWMWCPPMRPPRSGATTRRSSRSAPPSRRRAPNPACGRRVRTPGRRCAAVLAV